jgi:hypothetical protein
MEPYPMNDDSDDAVSCIVWLGDSRVIAKGVSSSGEWRASFSSFRHNWFQVSAW